MNNVCQEIILCPVCSSKSFKPFFSIAPDDFLHENKAYLNLDSIGYSLNTQLHYVKCKRCGCVFSNPRVKSSCFSLIYNDMKVAQLDYKEWIKDGSDMSALFNTFSKWMLFRSFIAPLCFLSSRFSHSKNKGARIKLLDFGSGFGHILDLAHVFGIEGKGIEIDERRIAYCKEKGHNVVRQDELGQETFDIIISTSVIEHVNNVEEVFIFFGKYLKEGGIIFISGLTPKIISFEKSKKIFKNVNPIEHLNLLTRKNVKQLSVRHGLSFCSRRMLFQALRRNGIMGLFLLPYLVFGAFRSKNGDFSALLVKSNHSN